MKLKRLKHARRVVSFYKNNFGFTAPLHVLIDGTFCKAALKFKVNISEQLPKYLDCEVKLSTTKCALAECEALGPLLYGPLKVLQQFTVNDCCHDNPIPASKCLLSMVRRQNEKKFYIATQDLELSDRTRLRAGIPLLFIAHNAIRLEAPADASRKRSDRKVQDNMAPGNFHKTILDKLKTEAFGEASRPAKRKSRKLKGPNPLSCRKKKTKSQTVTSIKSLTDNTQKKRKRKKKPKTKAAV